MALCRNRNEKIPDSQESSLVSIKIDNKCIIKRIVCFLSHFSAQAEEKRRQEEEEILSKKLHEEQALHEAQLKEV